MATALSLSEIRRRCAKVVADWTEEPGEQAQSFIKDLLGAYLLNCSETSPTIFSSLFQSAESAKARRQLGEHYTTEINILKTIEPLFLDELRTEFKTYYHDAKRLEKLRNEIGQLQVMDPACGCGNFPVVAYRELRQLDLEILKRLEELDPSAGGNVI